MATSLALTLPLESGDRLTRAEFHRIYLQRPDIHRAELVQGVVYVASPARTGLHGEPVSLINFWLNSYALDTPELRVSTDSTVFLDPDSELQPDAFLYWNPPRAHGAYLNDDDYIEGAPELVVEVAASSASYDLHDKKEAYRRAGVREYIVWRTRDRMVDWFRLQDGEYVLVEPDQDGVIESAIHPSLRLDIPALIAGDRKRLLASLARGRG